MNHFIREREGLYPKLKTKEGAGDPHLVFVCGYHIMDIVSIMKTVREIELSLQVCNRPCCLCVINLRACAKGTKCFNIHEAERGFLLIGTWCTPPSASSIGRGAIILPRATPKLQRGIWHELIMILLSIGCAVTKGTCVGKKTGMYLKVALTLLVLQVCVQFDPPMSAHASMHLVNTLSFYTAQ